MTWKIIDRVSQNYPGSIVHLLDQYSRLMYFWDEKYEGWSVVKEEQDKKNEIWFIVSIDKADDNWYLEGDVPVAVANWITQQKEKQNDSES